MKKEKVIALLLASTMIFQNNNVIVFASNDGTISEQYVLEENTEKASTPENDNIPEGAGYYNGHYYYVYDSAAGWSDAEAYCESLGGYLATITSQEENDYVFQYMKDSGHTSAYFGFTDEGSEGIWKWVTGESVSYTNWAGGEPSNDGNIENYAMFYYKFTTGKWNDGDFGINSQGRSREFICEWGDYVTDEDNKVLFNGNAYQAFHMGNYTWEQAKEYCEELGGHLATVTSLEEEEFIESLLLESKEFYWLGGKGNTSGGGWAWVTGESFSYENWDPKQPDNDGGECYLGITAMDTYYADMYKWNDYKNDGGSNSSLEDSGFVCEWDEYTEEKEIDIKRDTWGFKSYSGYIPLSVFTDLFGLTTGYEEKIFSVATKFEDDGRCFGMVLSAMASSYDAPPVASYGKKYLYEVIRQDYSASTKMRAERYIDYAYIYQKVPEYQQERNKHSNDLSGLYQSVKKYSEQKKNPVMILIFNGEGSGHALWGLKILSDDDIKTEILVYDCNWPGENRNLTLKKEDGVFIGWEYSLSSSKTWKGTCKDNSISYAQLTEKFINVFGKKSGYSEQWNMLVSLPKGYSKPLFSNYDNVLPIRICDGEEQSKIQQYWVNTGTKGIELADVTAETEINLAVYSQAVSVKTSVDSDYIINLENNTDNNSIEMKMESQGVFETTYYQAVDNSDKMRIITLQGQGNDDIAIEQEDGNFLLEGATDLDVMIKEGELNEEGDLLNIQESAVSADNLDDDITYRIYMENDSISVDKEGSDIDISTCNALLSQTSYVYDKTEKTPAVTVTLGDQILEEGVHYAVTYADNKKAGTATVTVTAIEGSGYSGSKTETFTIQKAARKITLSGDAVKGYTRTVGNSFYPDVDVSPYYTPTWTSSNSNVAKIEGTGIMARVYVKGAGTAVITVSVPETQNYLACSIKFSVTGRPRSQTTTTVTKPKKTKITSARKKGTKMTIKWKKVSDADGYELQYFAGARGKKRTVTIYRGKTTKKVIKRLSASKKYYVRIRAFKWSGGGKKYSAWTKKKKVK